MIAVPVRTSAPAAPTHVDGVVIGLRSAPKPRWPCVTKDEITDECVHSYIDRQGQIETAPTIHPMEARCANTMPPILRKPDCQYQRSEQLIAYEAPIYHTIPVFTA